MSTKAKTPYRWLFLLGIHGIILWIAAEAPVQAQNLTLSITATPSALKPGQSVTITAATSAAYDATQYQLSVVVTYQGQIVNDFLLATTVTPTSSTYIWKPAGGDPTGTYAVAALLAPLNPSAKNLPELTAQTLVNVNSNVVNGACGSADGVVSVSAPTANLCSAGVASKVAAYTGAAAEGVWQWNCAGSNGGATASCASTNSLPSRAAQFTLDFTDDTALTAFLQNSKQPNVNYVVPINYTGLGSLIKAKGYKVQVGIGGYAAQWVQGYVLGRGAVSTAARDIYAIIDNQVAAGATMIWLNEIFRLQAKQIGSLRPAFRIMSKASICFIITSTQSTRESYSVYRWVAGNSQTCTWRC